MRGLAVLMAILVLALPARAQTLPPDTSDLVIDLAQRTVDITIGYDGARVSLFGVKRQPGDVAVVIRGPLRSLMVRRKSQILGIWMNARSVEFVGVPFFYDYALSVPVNQLAPPDVLRANGIGLDALSFEPRDVDDAPRDIAMFQEALIRNMQVKGFFPLEPRRITYLSNDFFRIDLNIPASIPPGTYTIETFLFSGGALMERDATEIRVQQAGLEAEIYFFAYENAVFYGLLAVALAVSAGAGAHFFLRRA